MRTSQSFVDEVFSQLSLPWDPSFDLHQLASTPPPANSFPLEESEPFVWGWSISRGLVVNATMKRHGIRLLLDVGSGDGRHVLKYLKADCIATEPVPHRARSCAGKGFAATILCSFRDLVGLRNMPAIGLFDVLEYLDPSAVDDLWKMLSPGGKLVLTVPIGPMSEFDLSIGNLRRYEVTDFIASLEAHGFEVIEARPLFSFLVPLRGLRGQPVTKRGSVGSLRRLSESIVDLASLAIVPLTLVERLLPPPQNGLSLLVVAQKPCG